jgi:hypothetical protein
VIITAEGLHDEPLETLQRVRLALNERGSYQRSRRIPGGMAPALYRPASCKLIGLPKSRHRSENRSVRMRSSTEFSAMVGNLRRSAWQTPPCPVPDARGATARNISYGARIVDILVPSVLRLLAKPVAPLLLKPGSSASSG